MLINLRYTYFNILTLSLRTVNTGLLFTLRYSRNKDLKIVHLKLCFRRYYTYIQENIFDNNFLWTKDLDPGDPKKPDPDPLSTK